MLVVLTIIFEHFSWQSKKRRFFESFCCGLVVFSLLFLKKETVGIDTPTYKKIYDWVITTNFTSLSSGYSTVETPFKFLMKVFSSCGLSYQIFSVFIYACLFTSLLLLFFYYADVPGLAWLFFLCFGSFTFVASALRQGFSISLTIFAFLIFKKEKIGTWFGSALLVALAFAFHNSAASVLLLAPGFFIKNKQKNCLYFITALVLVSIFSYPALFYLYNETGITNRYLFSYDSFYWEGFGGSAVVMMLIIFYYYFSKSAFYKETKSFSPHFKLFERIPDPIDSDAPKQNDGFFLFSCEFCVILFVIACFFDMIARIADYSRIYFGVVLINAINRQKTKTARITSFCMMVLFLSFYFYYTTFRLNYLGLLPYSFFWQ